MAYRKRFLEQMASLRPWFSVYAGEDMDQIIPPILSPNIPEIVLVTHNESVFYANDGIVTTWGPAGENQIW